MELETAVRRLLLADETVAGYVGDKVFKNTLEEHVDGTGGRAVTVFRTGGWTAPDPVSSAEFPLLQVNCFADCDRDDDGLVTSRNAIDKAFAVYRSVDRLLHGAREEWWGAGGRDEGLMIVSCARYVEPIAMEAQDQHATANVGNAQVPLGDSAFVWARYACVVVH